MRIASFTPDDGLPRCSVCGQTEETPRSSDPRVAACPLCGRVLNFVGGAEFPAEEPQAPAEDLATSWEAWRYRFARALLTRQSRYHIARELTHFGLRFTPAVAAGVWRLRNEMDAQLITHDGAEYFSVEHQSAVQSVLLEAVELRETHFPPTTPDEFQLVLMPLRLDEQTLVLELVVPRESAEREAPYLINRLRALRGAMTAAPSPPEPGLAEIRYSSSPAMILHGPPRPLTPAPAKPRDIDPPQPNVPPRSFWDWLNDTWGAK